MQPDAITKLLRTRFEGVRWGPGDKPVLVADGRLYRVTDLDCPVSAGTAYVVGVNQASFELLARFLRSEIIHFYEMRVADLAALTSFTGLRQLALCWNTKLEDISVLAAIEHLEVLVLSDTPKVHDLAPLAQCSLLSALEFSGGIQSKNYAESLTPLAQMPSLEDLVLANLKVETGGLRPLADCKRLRNLWVSNQFPTEDYAFLSVKLPNVQCNMFQPFVPLSQPVGGKDAMIVGKGRGFLNSREDAVKIEKYKLKFAELQSRFATDAFKGGLRAL